MHALAFHALAVALAVFVFGLTAFLAYEFRCNAKRGIPVTRLSRNRRAIERERARGSCRFR